MAFLIDDTIISTINFTSKKDQLMKHKKLVIMLSLLVLIPVGVGRWHSFTINRELGGFKSFGGFQSWQIGPRTSINPICLDQCSNGYGTFTMSHNADVYATGTSLVNFMKDQGYTSVGTRLCEGDANSANETTPVCSIWGDKNFMRASLDISYDVSYDTVNASVSY